MNPQIARRYVIATAALALTFRIAYAFVTPPFQAPDEYPHFSYVRFIHDFHRLPVQSNPAVQAEELEFHQPPLYYVVAAAMYPSKSLVEGRPVLPMRFLNILFSMLTIVVGYYFASILFAKNPFVVAFICSGIGLLPTYSYLSGTMRNGVLATFFASLGFYLCSKAVLEDEQQRHARWSWVGVVAGLAILSKLSAIGFVCAVGLTLLLTGKNWKEALYKTGWFSLGLVTTSGWWFARNWSLYGQVLKVIENGDRYVPPPVSWAHEKKSAIILFKTFWAVFGRYNEFHFADIYRLCWIFAGLSILGIIVWSIRQPVRLPVRLLILFSTAILISLSATFYYAHAYNSDQGRYMFPALLPITTFIALGFSAIFPERYHRHALDLVMLTFATINTVVIVRLAWFYWPIM